MDKHLKNLIYKVTQNFETPSNTSTDPSSMFLYILNLSTLIWKSCNEVINGVMFGITTIVKGYSFQTYFLYCYAIFLSEDITRKRGGVTFGTPCINDSVCLPFTTTECTTNRNPP